MSWVQAALVVEVSRWNGNSVPIGGLVVFAGSGCWKAGAWIGESTHSPVASEIVVEGTILLDDDDHVLECPSIGSKLRDNRSGRRDHWTPTAAVQTQSRQLGGSRGGPEASVSPGE